MQSAVSHLTLKPRTYHLDPAKSIYINGILKGDVAKQQFYPHKAQNTVAYVLYLYGSLHLSRGAISN